MSSGDRIVQNTGILYAKMGITVFISLYTTRLILVALGVNDFGIFNLVGGAIAMLTFLNTAMAAATQRFMSFAEGSGDSDKLNSIFNVSVVLHFIIAIIILVLLEVAGHYLFLNVFKIPIDRIDSAKLVYQFMIFSTLFTIISVPYDAVINAHENMLLFAILGVIESVLKLAIAYYIIKTSYDKLIVFGLLTALLSIFLLLLHRIYCNKYYKECKINLKLHFDKSIFKELTSFAGWSFLGAASSMLSNYGQGIVLNAFFGPLVNTAQGIANQVSGQLGVFAGTMQKALNPVIDKSEGAGDRTMMLRATMFGSKTSFFLLMLFVVPVIIELPYIFRLWLSTIPEYAIIFCRLLLIRNLIEQIFLTLVSSISAVGNIKKFQIYTSILNFTPLIGSYIFFQLNYPPYTLYYLFIIYTILLSGIILYFAKVVCGISITSFLQNVVLRCIVSLLVVSTVAFYTNSLFAESLLRLSIIIITSTISYIFIVWLYGYNSSEKSSIRLVALSIYGKLIKYKKNLNK